jgi:thiol-disulfide isomerase/thioredoxin
MSVNNQLMGENGGPLDSAKDFLKDNFKTIGLVIFAAALFIGAAYYIYVNYVKQKMDPDYVDNKEFIAQDKDKNTPADIYYFYTDWCPHSKKARPEWDNFKESIGNSLVKGHKVNFIEVNAEKDIATADKFKVEGYPTIKMVLGNQVIEYDAKPNKDTLTKFVNTTLS